MKQNALLVALVVALAALAVVVVRQRSEIADFKQAAHVVSAKHSVPTERPGPVAAKEESLPPAEPSPAAPTPAPADDGNTSAPANPMSGLAGMMKNPQMKEMVRAQQKMMLDRQFGSLFKYLNTRPPTELDALKQLLFDRQMALVDAGMAMMGGSAEERKKAIEESKTVKAEYGKKFEDLLGAQDYDVFKQYEATAAERMQVQMFKEALPADGTLTDQQENDLILAMADERKAVPASSLWNKKNPDPSQMTEESVNEALKQMEAVQKRYADRAAAILTPAQLEQFTKFQQQWNTIAATGLKMSQAMFGNKGTSSAHATTGQNP